MNKPLALAPHASYSLGENGLSAIPTPEALPKTNPTPDLFCQSESKRIWQGLGICFNELGWDALLGLPETERNTLLEAVFASGAFPRCRMPIGANDYALSWYSLNETPGDLAMEHFSIERDRETLLPYIRAALRHDPRLTLFASPWSPPTWMKHPCAYNYGSLRGDPEVHRAYALYFHRFVEAMRAEGIPVEAVHVQNEPDSDQKFPSCRWSGEKLRDFIRDHLGPLFADTPPGGRPCDVWLGTIERGCYRSWIAPALNDPEARKYIAGVGFQWAGSGAIQRTHHAWPDLPLAQTENECGDGENTWKHAEHVFNLFQHYLHNGASAYCYWNLALPHPKGLSTWGWPQNCMITVDPAQQTYALNPEFHLMRLLGHCATPGADIVPLSGPFAAHAVAFRDTDTLRVALHNPFPDAQSVTLTHDAHSWCLHLAPHEIHVYSFPRT